MGYWNNRHKIDIFLISMDTWPMVKLDKTKRIL